MNITNEMIVYGSIGGIILITAIVLFFNSRKKPQVTLKELYDVEPRVLKEVVVEGLEHPKHNPVYALPPPKEDASFEDTVLRELHKRLNEGTLPITEFEIQIRGLKVKVSHSPEEESIDQKIDLKYEPWQEGLT